MQEATLNLMCWNVAALAPTLRNIDLKYGSFKGFMEELNVGLACLQETKLSEGQLTKDAVCVDGYESYWAVSREKKGYSGVVTYAMRAWGAVHAEVDCLGSGESDIDREGRIVVSDHGAFVLMNVYVPNAGDRPARARLGFKLEFLRALQRKADSLRAEGREVLLVGDFNVAASAADVHPTMDFEGMYAAEELAALHSFFRDEAYVDVWRHLHPGVKDQFTVWDERTSARAFNRGLRIDYVLCTPGLLPHVRGCEVLSTEVLPPKWSDHAGLMLRLQGLTPPAPPTPCTLWLRRRETVVDSRQRSIRDMFGGAGAKRGRTEERGPGPPPASVAKRAVGAGGLAAAETGKQVAPRQEAAPRDAQSAPPHGDAVVVKVPGTNLGGSRGPPAAKSKAGTPSPSQRSIAGFLQKTR